MTEPAPQTPEERPHRATADPLQMSVAEKLACEWEARHDVAARGRLTAPAPVQHYLAHERSEHNRRPSDVAHRPRREAAAPIVNIDGVPPGLRGWLRWVTSGGDPDRSGLHPER